MVKKEKKEVQNKDIFEEARKKRLEIFNSLQKKDEEVEDSREEFRLFFVKIKNKLKLSADLEKVIWLHFKSYGFDNKASFEKGIKHFGYKL